MGGECTGALPLCITPHNDWVYYSSARAVPIARKGRQLYCRPFLANFLCYDGLAGDLCLEGRQRLGERPRAQVAAIARAYGHGLRGGFLIAHDEHIWHLLQLGVAALCSHTTAPPVYP